MIRVIAADMDGTLLNSNHTISENTYQMIQEVQRRGIRFMIATGRDFPSASDVLRNFPLECDWVTGSGAEIRNADGELLQTVPMNPECFDRIVSCVRRFPAGIRFCTTGRDLVLTDSEDLEVQILKESRMFFGGNAHDKIKEAAEYITKSHDDDGAAYAMKLVLENQLCRIRKTDANLFKERKVV